MIGKIAISSGALLLNLLLTSCTNVDSPTRIANNLIYKKDIATTTELHYPARQPQQVALFRHHKSPRYPYRIIGIASVDKKNIFGNERDTETIELMMKQLAASIGGDGVIDFIRQRDKIQASVIMRQHVLV